MNTNIEKIKQKLEKLLRLAGSPNKHEAELAMAKAREVVVQYNLDLAAVAAQENRAVVFTVDFVRVPVMGTGPAVQNLYHYVSMALSNSLECRCIRHKTQSGHAAAYTFVGEVMDLEIVKYCWEWLTNTFRLEFANYSKARFRSFSSSGEREKARRSFYEGLMHGIIDANKKAVPESACTAIVLADKKAQVDAKVDEMYDGLKQSRKGQNVNHDYHAATHGLVRGKNIKLARGLEGQGSKPAIAG